MNLLELAWNNFLIASSLCRLNLRKLLDSIIFLILESYWIGLEKNGNQWIIWLIILINSGIFSLIKDVSNWYVCKVKHEKKTDICAQQVLCLWQLTWGD